ncbi:MAG TPA: hypothetical protein VMB66_11560 [Candidatus Acidoferrales bacterium]|nr:hypothetical protein [Candidatus Acidoferrales bacterium]
MFPGIDGFHWTFGHILFLSLFFVVALTILTTVASAVWRTAKDFRTHKAIDFYWKENFSELPERDRRCRHELAGRVISRVCDNAFDCRHCENYAQFVVLPATGHVNSLGLNYSDDRYYHRGHTWLKPEQDGTVAIGLDDLVEHLVGDPDSVRMPEIGEELELNQVAWRMRKNDKEIQVRAPLEGTVIAVGGPREGWYLRLQPRLDLHNLLTFRHLLRGPEVRGWVAREAERLQLQLRAPNTPAALADGGVLMPDLMSAIPEADWDTVLADTFLQT